MWCYCHKNMIDKGAENKNPEPVKSVKSEMPPALHTQPLGVTQSLFAYWILMHHCLYKEYYKEYKEKIL